MECQRATVCKYAEGRHDITVGCADEKLHLSGERNVADYDLTKSCFTSYLSNCSGTSPQSQCSQINYNALVGLLHTACLMVSRTEVNKSEQEEASC